MPLTNVIALALFYLRNWWGEMVIFPISWASVGNKRLLASPQVQQGNPLDPLLFLPCYLQFIDAINLFDVISIEIFGILMMAHLLKNGSSLLSLLSLFATQSQGKLCLLDTSQIEPYILCSCFSSCKITHSSMPCFS